MSNYVYAGKRRVVLYHIRGVTKMQTFCVLLVIFLHTVYGQDTSSSAGYSVKWKNVRASYQRFDQIQPVLRNEGKRSIYLNRLYPGGARLERFNDKTREWELSGWSFTCGTVVDATVHIEIKPGESRPIDVHWILAVDDIQ